MQGDRLSRQAIEPGVEDHRTVEIPYGKGAKGAVVIRAELHHPGTGEGDGWVAGGIKKHVAFQLPGEQVVGSL